MSKIKWYLIIAGVCLLLGFGAASIGSAVSTKSLRSDLATAKARSVELEGTISKASGTAESLRIELGIERENNNRLRVELSQEREITVRFRTELDNERELNKRLADTISASNRTVGRIDDLIGQGESILEGLIKAASP